MNKRIKYTSNKLRPSLRLNYWISISFHSIPIENKVAPVLFCLWQFSSNAEFNYKQIETLLQQIIKVSSCLFTFDSKPQSLIIIGIINHQASKASVRSKASFRTVAHFQQHYLLGSNLIILQIFFFPMLFKFKLTILFCANSVLSLLSPAVCLVNWL